MHRKHKTAGISKQARMRSHQILIVDDHALVREGLVRILQTQPDLAVCGEAGDVAGALEVIDRRQPDLVLLDLALEGKGGLALLEELRRRELDLPVLVLSMHDERLYGERVLRAGARGYLMKHEPAEKVIEGIRIVLRGEFCFSPDLQQHLMRQISQGAPGAGAAADGGVGRLTNRELQVLELIGRGHSTRTIATQLNLSPKTVEAHRVRIRNRLQLPDAAALLHFAIRWVDTDGAGHTFN